MSERDERPEPDGQDGPAADGTTVPTPGGLAGQVAGPGAADGEHGGPTQAGEERSEALGER